MAGARLRRSGSRPRPWRWPSASSCSSGRCPWAGSSRPSTPLLNTLGALLAGRAAALLARALRGLTDVLTDRARAVCDRLVPVVSVLSIQSHVAYGHVGNSSAVFPLQRLGIEVWPVHTVQFSNHTGYGEWTGRVFDGQAVEEVVQGIAARGVLGRCDAVLSGYLGSADIGHAVVPTVGQVREANADAVYCCDPVIGDVGRGVFVRPGIEEFMREVAVPAADIVTPNHFELDLLSGSDTTSLPAVKDAVAAVHDLGPRVVLTTSLVTDDTPDDAVDLHGVGRAGGTSACARRGWGSR